MGDQHNNLKVTNLYPIKQSARNSDEHRNMTNNKCPSNEYRRNNEHVIEMERP